MTTADCEARRDGQAMTGAASTANMRQALPLLAILLASGCQQEEAGLVVRLTPTPALNSEAQLVGALERVELQLDAPGGFAGVAGNGQPAGAFEAIDVDSDGVPELQVSRAVSAEDGLPQLRILAGDNGAPESFSLTAYGYQGDTIIATGRVLAVRFVPDKQRDLIVPFDLLASFRAPRVRFTLPRDGQTQVPQTLGAAYVEFSSLLSDEALAGDGLRLSYQGSAGRVPVVGAWQRDTLTTTLSATLSEQNTTATLQLPAECTLSPGVYRLEATGALRDTAGRRLDQDASTEQLDPYVGFFAIPGAATAQPCSGDVVGCREDRDCVGSDSQQLVCFETRCVPAAVDCDTLACGDGQICRPASVAGGRAVCVDDCRKIGNDCGDLTSCDELSGLCIADTQPCPSCNEPCNGAPQSSDCRNCINANCQGS